ncbi:MAG TPA: VOC family protein [Patescibacteria group bacterium]|nr:VOC family protein [Patescibacteria group bacterium]
MTIPDIEGLITFTYYKDLNKAAKFYSEVMGFEQVIDVDFAKVYRVTGSSHIGIVDGNRGSIKPTEDKPLMISVVVDDIEAWHERLKEHGVDIFQPPQDASYLEMKTLLFRDPEGYILEILEFLKKPYGS